MYKKLLKNKNWIVKSVLITLAFFVSNSHTHAATIGKPNNFLLQSGLVGWWTFDPDDMTSNVQDKSGNGNHGYLTGITATTSMFVPGRSGQALQFDGVNDDLRILDTASIDGATGAGQARTWSVWLKRGAGSNNLVIDKSSGFVGNHFWIEYTTSSKIRGGVAPTGGITSATSLRVGEWYHVTFTYDGSNTRMYINGLLDAGPTAQTAPADDANALFLMGYTNEQYSASGALDDFRIYNRALSANEVLVLYRLNSVRFSITPSGSAADGLKVGLVGHWTFDRVDMVPNVRDRSGQGNDGRISGQTATTTVPGRIGQGLFLDGVDDAVRIPDASSLDITDALTISAWVQYAGVNVSGETIINKGNTAGGSIPTQSYRLDFYDNRRPRFAVSSGSTVLEVTAPINFLQKDEWYHLVGVFDGLETSYFYINNQLIGSNTSVGFGAINIDDTYGLGIGARADASSLTTSAIDVDDVRIYNRALNTTEIAKVYAEGSAKQASSVVQSGSLSSGLVGHWTFDGPDMVPNVRDRSGQGNHGNLIGQTTTTTAPGELGQALRFDGVNDYINCGSDASVLPNTFSFSAWVKTNTTASASALIGLGANSYPYFALHFSTNRPLLYLAASNYRYWSATTPTNLVNSDWHHYVVVLPGNSIGDISNAVLYVDGRVQDVSNTVSSEAQASKSLCKLGGYHTAGTFSPLNGLMDDARLYNRTLTASEVLQLYNLGR